MTNVTVLTSNQVLRLASLLIEQISAYNRNWPTGPLLKCFPIPRGGVPAALALVSSSDYVIVDTPEAADFFIDDIIDSGETLRKWCDLHPEKPFFALIDKTDPGCPYLGAWVVFPWEHHGDGLGRQHDMQSTITRLLQQIGEDPTREGLLDTPARVAKAWDFWTCGYAQDPADVLKVFSDGAEKCDEMVIVKDIPFYTHCEHHMAPFFGTASIAYIPDGKIVGLSKLSRVLQIFARRLQVQERLTNQVADAIEKVLEPKGVGVVIKARHLCMESRGICQQGHQTVTSALRGAMRNNASARAEFMALVQ